MPRGFKQISKLDADKICQCYFQEKTPEHAILQFNGKFYDITEAEPLDIADFIQLERYIKMTTK